MHRPVAVLDDGGWGEVRADCPAESGAEREVVVRFRGASAPLARERWPERAREDAGGSVAVAMKVTPGNYLYGFVLGHGGEATVEAPPDVIEAFRARVAELARLYR